MLIYPGKAVAKKGKERQKWAMMAQARVKEAENGI